MNCYEQTKTNLFLYVESRLILICNVMLRPASLFLAAVPAGSESTAWRKQTKMDKRLWK